MRVMDSANVVFQAFLGFRSPDRDTMSRELSRYLFGTRIWESDLLATANNDNTLSYYRGRLVA
jgi:hypothetical protein